MMCASKITISGLAGLLAIALAGCAARAKTAAANPAVAKAAAPATPAAPAPLSIPQTTVELPKPQPIDPAALEVEAAPPVTAGTVNVPRNTPPPQKKSVPTRTDTPAQPPVAASLEPTRQPVQEIVSAADLKRLQDSAQNRKREVAKILSAINPKRLSPAQRNVLNSIHSFVKLSDDSEKRNEMRQADALAERAQILARDLQHGK